jgi:asparagine synthase (glutamine-hydrolysing)
VCGICGIYGYGHGEPADQALVREMTGVMTHRGPDDDGYHFDGSLGLGMRRLSIIDLEGGAQPIAGDRDAWVISNGEIYNFRELRTQLEGYGHRFRSRTDTETIVRGFEQWGFSVLERLNGMFGIALWDARERTLILARDPYGIKPLYYRDDGRSVTFGSEIKSILCAPEVPRSVDADALDAFLSFTFVPSPATAFAGISKLPPGHALVCTPDGCRVRRFHFAVPQHLEEQDERCLIADLQELILAAVRRQMVADVPVGALLSGGVDSTTVATIMSQIAPQSIDTFTVGFVGGASLNELGYAAETAGRIASRQHELVISAEEYADFLPRSVWHLEDLVATDSTLAYYKVCELARRTVKVVLSGQGADEPFAGYPRHLGERYGWALRRLPASAQAGIVTPLVKALPRNARLKRAVRALSDPDVRRRMIAVWTIMDVEDKRRLYAPGLQPEVDASMAACAVWEKDVRHLDGLSRMLYCDARFSLADNLLLYGDKMSMAVSLEARVPLLDLELMRFAEAIPPRLKIKGRTRKYILRQAVRRWVPDDVLRRKKIPFESPIDHWLRTDLASHTRELLLSPGSACREHFSQSGMQRLVADHVDGRQDNRRILLALIVFELWHQQFIKPSTAALRRVMVQGSNAGGSVS